MNSLAIKTLGTGGADGAGGTSYSQPYQFLIYAISGTGNTNASLQAVFQSQSFSFSTGGDWLQMMGLNFALLPNTVYAYTFTRTLASYENLGFINGNPYPGGQICEIPTSGGMVNYGTAPLYDATFDVGLALPTGLTVNPPTASAANPVTRGATVTLTSGTVVGNSGSYTYQWQTDGGSGTLTNIPGATSSTLAVNTTGLNLGGIQYAVVVTDSSSATATSSSYAMDVIATILGTFTDAGTTTPSPGGYDVAQLTTASTYQVAGNLNYYDDNATPPGQTFTTGTNPKGYSIDSLSVLFKGGGSSGTTTAQGYDVFLYSISADGTTATLMADVTNLGSFAYGDWVNVAFPGVTLNPNSTYAYTFHRRTTGYAGLSTSAGGDAYPGGQICTIPTAGGPVGYSTSSGEDGTFDVGLVPLGLSVLVNTPTATPNPVYALTPVKLADTGSGGILTYQWLTDDGSGSVPPNYINIPGATGTNYTFVPQDVNPGGSDYTTNFYFVAKAGGNSTTSSVVTVTVHAASIPQFSSTPTPTNLVTFVGQDYLTYSAPEVGTLPITNQWLFNGGSGYANITGQTNTTLTLSNLQGSASGTYELTAANLLGGTNVAASLTVVPDPASPLASDLFAYRVFTNHPWAYWMLNETNDPTAAGAPTYTAYDYSGHGFDAMYGSSVTVSNAGPQPPTFPGFSSQELAAGTTYASVNGALTVPALNLSGQTNLTFMAWIYPNGPQNGAAGLLFNRGGPDNACGFGFGNTTDHLGYTWDNNSQSTWSWESGLAVTEGQWNFVAYVITPTNTTVYLGSIGNGTTNFVQSVNSIANTAETFAGGIILLGGDAESSGRTFNGLICDAGLLTNALSSSQLQQYFLAGLGASSLPPTVNSLTVSPSQSVYSGQNVLLTASTSGTPPLTNIWQSSTDGSTWSTLTGANGTTLVANPQIVGSLYYQFIVRSSGGASTSSPVQVTFTALPTTPPGQWTVNFQTTNNIGAGQATGGGLGYYVGRGVLGNGTYWNILPEILADGAGYNSENIVSVTDLRDDGATHSGIYCHMNNGGGYNGLGTSLPYPQDIGNLLDQFYRTYYSDGVDGNGALQFFGVPAGTYNLVCYAGDGATSNGASDTGTTFVVYDPVNGDQTNSTADTTSGSQPLTEGVNFVTFTNVHISGTLNVDLLGNASTSGSATVSGAQLQLVSYDASAPAVTLSGSYANHSLTLSWPQGILETATNLLGPWVQIDEPSPITVPVTTTNTAVFYRVQIH